MNMYPHNPPPPHVCVFGRVFQTYVWRLDNNLPKFVFSYHVGSRDPTQVLRFGRKNTYLPNFFHWSIFAYNLLSHESINSVRLLTGKKQTKRQLHYPKPQTNWVMIGDLGITYEQYSSLESLPCLHNSLLEGSLLNPENFRNSLKVVSCLLAESSKFSYFLSYNKFIQNIKILFGRNCDTTHISFLLRVLFLDHGEE